MKIFRSIEDYNLNQRTILTIGTFDGVHIGHQTIINKINRIAKRCNGESVLLTFEPHPRKVILNDSSSLKLINSIIFMKSVKMNL